MVIEFSMSLRVYDVRAFVRAAQDRAIADGLCKTRMEAARNFDIRATHMTGCAVMLFDPGQSPAGSEILDSRADSEDI